MFKVRVYFDLVNRQFKIMDQIYRKTTQSLYTWLHSAKVTWVLYFILQTLVI